MSGLFQDLDVKYAVIYGIVALIINYICINYVVIWLFPDLKKYKQFKNKLLTEKVSVPIVKGACSFTSSEVDINTSNPKKDEYVYLPDSNNLKGGAQFSYTFWLKLNGSGMTNFSGPDTTHQGKVIFMRGIYRNFGNTDNKRNNEVDGATEKVSNALVKCPLIKLGPSSLIEIEFNTIKNYNNSIKLDEEIFDMVLSGDNNTRWFLYTIVFQDYVDFNNAEKGVDVKVFINDALIKTETIRNDSLKINHGNVYLTPELWQDADTKIEDSKSMYGDVTYHNHALDIIDIQSIYDLGISNTKQCVTAKQIASLSESKKNEYQRLSVYNELHQVG
jgi:hypothetical protein